MGDRMEREDARGEKPLVSVIVPVYNGAQHLPACLDSLLGQTLRALEVILVDDGSTDATPGVCDAYARRDGRVRVLSQGNRGPSAARNAGLAAAAGRYIGFVDADDLAMPRLYETLYDVLAAAPPRSVAVCGYDILAEDGVRANPLPSAWPDRFSVPAGEAWPYLFSPGSYECHVWNKLYDRALFDGPDGLRFSEDLWLCEDRLLMAQLLARAGEVRFTGAVGYRYRFRAGAGRTNPRAGSPLRALEARRRLLRVLPPAWADYDGAVYTCLLARAVCEAQGRADRAQFAALRAEYRLACGSYPGAPWRWRRHLPASAGLLRLTARVNSAPGYALLRLLWRLRGKAPDTPSA